MEKVKAFVILKDESGRETLLQEYFDAPDYYRGELFRATDGGQYHVIEVVRNLENYPYEIKVIKAYTGEFSLLKVDIVSPYNFRKGDYVLAVKYMDADPKDPWRVGYIEDVIEKPSGSHAILFKETGQRKYNFAKKITQEEGDKILNLWPQHLIKDF